MRQFSQLLDSWGWVLLLVSGGAVTAALNNWRPWESIALVAVLGLAGAAIAAVSAWEAVRTREIELAALTSDEQAARLLGEALHRCGPYLPDKQARDVWDTFNCLPSDAKRAMALALVGFLGDSGQYELMTVGPKLVSIAHSFRDTAEAR